MRLGIYEGVNSWRLRCMATSNTDARMAATGVRWNKDELAWEYPQTAENFEALRKAFPTLPVESRALDKYREIKRRADSISDLKLQPWGEAQAIEPLPIKVKAFQHQVAAYNLACAVLGVVDNG